MSKTPWDSGGMNQHENYDESAQFSNGVPYNQHPQEYRYDHGRFPQPTFQSGWNQNYTRFPQDQPNHLPVQNNLAHLNHSLMANSNETPDAYGPAQNSGYDFVHDYEYGYGNNSAYWPEQNVQMDAQHHYNFQDQYSGDKHLYNYHGVANQQHSDIETNQLQSPRAFESQAFVSKNEDAVKQENIPMTEDIAAHSSAGVFLKEEVQSSDMSSHIMDQQVLLLASEPPTVSSNIEQVRPASDANPPPIGTMTGIPTRNQFRKAPLKKSPYHGNVNDDSTSYHGNMDLFQTDQKLVVSHGSGDYVDSVVDSNLVVTEESVDQKLADNEVALYNQSCPSPSPNLDPASQSQLSELAVQPILPTKPSEEFSLQTEKNIPIVDIDVEHEETKSLTDEAKFGMSQTHFSDLVSPLHYLSRKKLCRDSTLSPATTLWENIDISPLKLGPKLVPAQEVEVMPSVTEEGTTAKVAPSPVQNTGTGPSNNNLNSDLNPISISSSYSEKQPISTNVPSGLDVDLTSVSLDSTIVNSKNTFQLASTKVGLISFKENSVQNSSGKLQMTLVPNNHQETSQQSEKPSYQLMQFSQDYDKQPRSHEQSPHEHQFEGSISEPQQMFPQQLQQMQSQPSLEGDQHKQSGLSSASQISDPHHSAFSTVKPALLTSLPNSATHASSQGVRGMENMNVDSSKALPIVNRKTSYSALNPEPPTDVWQPQSNAAKPNNESIKRQENIGTHESRSAIDLRPLSRQRGDITYYNKEDLPLRREYNDHPQYNDHPRYDDDPLRHQRPDSRSYYRDEVPRRPYEESPHDRPLSRRGYEPEGQYVQRSGFSRPPSRSDDLYDDRRRAHEFHSQERPLSRHATYDDRDQPQNLSRRVNNDPRSHLDDRNRYHNDRYSQEDYNYSRYNDRSQMEDRSRYQGDRFKYPEDRSKYGRYDGPDSKYRYYDNVRHPDDRARYHDNNSMHQDRPVKYSDNRYREMDDPYRSRSRQGQLPVDQYRARPRDGSQRAYEETYDRPRSRQEDQYPMSKEMEDYIKMLIAWNNCHGQNPVVDWNTYYNYYNRGYQDETASYGQTGQLDSSVQEMESTRLSSRASSRDFNPVTAADQFAMESHDGSRAASQLSEYKPAKEEVKRRLTPFKYSRSHIRASFSASGQLVQVLPNNPSEGQPAIVRILSLCESESEEVKEMYKFPGPLVRGVHKNDVQDFCKQMSTRCKDDYSLIDRSSTQLIWDFLSLLIKQNGSIIGTDVAELLIQGRDLNSHHDNSSTDFDEFNSMTRGGFDRTVISGENPDNQSEEFSVEQVTNRFRELLLCGRKKDALEWAMKHNLWGHALYLASQMDAKTHAVIKTKFTNVSMKANDPLQTLYQIMSGRQPSSVTLLDERWGDWRPHLSMIVSNATSKPDLDKRSIIILGDTLASRGLLHASHFCYLVAQTIFGNHNVKNSKLVLIGSSQGLPLKEFATNTAIWATEVYEYAISLADANFNMASLVPYKFIYLIRLLDLGLFEEALKYVEVIAQSIIRNPGVHSPAIIKFVASLSISLKTWDPQHDSAMQEGEQEPVWCTKLLSIAKMVEDGAIRFREGALSPQLSSTGASSEIGEIMMVANPSGEDLTDNHWSNQSSHSSQFNQVQPVSNDWSNPNQGFNLSANQDHLSTNQHHLSANQDHLSTNQHQLSANQHHWSNQQNAEVPSVPHSLDVQQNQGFVYGDQGVSGYSYIPPHGETTKHAEAPVATWSDQIQYPEFTIGSGEMEKIPEESRHDIRHPHQHHHHHQHQVVSQGSRSRTTSSGSNASRKSSGVPPPTSGKTWDDPYQFGVKPTISNDTLMSGMNQPLGAHSPVDKPKKKQAFPNDDDDDNDSDNFNGNKQKIPSDKKTDQSGWKLFNFWKSKKSNEVHLPDDKEPKFDWDEDKKAWVNKDGDVTGHQELPSAPPMIQNLPPPEHAGINRYSITAKPRGARGQYTDVFGSTAKPESAVPSTLLSTLPKSASTPANIFNPIPQQGVDSMAETSLQQHQQHVFETTQQQQQPTHQQQFQPPNMPDNSQQPVFPTQFFDPSQLKNSPQTISRQPQFMNNKGPYMRH